MTREKKDKQEAKDTKHAERSYPLKLKENMDQVFFLLLLCYAYILNY